MNVKNKDFRNDYLDKPDTKKKSKAGMIFVLILLMVATTILTSTLFISIAISQATTRESLDLIANEVNTQQVENIISATILDNLSEYTSLPGVTSEVLEAKVDEVMVTFEMNSFVKEILYNYTEKYLYGKNIEVLNSNTINEFIETVKVNFSFIEGSTFDNMGIEINNTLQEKLNTLNSKLHYDIGGKQYSIDDLQKISVILSDTAQMVLVGFLILLFMGMGILFFANKQNIYLNLFFFGGTELFTGMVLLFLSKKLIALLQNIQLEKWNIETSLHQVVNQTFVKQSWSLIYLGLGMLVFFCFSLIADKIMKSAVRRNV